MKFLQNKQVRTVLSNVEKHWLKLSFPEYINQNSRNHCGTLETHSTSVPRLKSFDVSFLHDTIMKVVLSTDTPEHSSGNHFVVSSCRSSSSVVPGDEQMIRNGVSYLSLVVPQLSIALIIQQFCSSYLNFEQLLQQLSCIGSCQLVFGTCMLVGNSDYWFRTTMFLT